MGDFSSVRTLEEKRGLTKIPIGGVDMDYFNSFIDDMEVEDVPLVGLKYTWFRGNNSLANS